MKNSDFKSNHIQPNRIAVLGIPFDANSSFLRGSALAPSQIQDSFYSCSSNLWTENQTDLEASSSWKFVGNVEFSESTLRLKRLKTLLQTCSSIKPALFLWAATIRLPIRFCGAMRKLSPI